MAVGKYRQKHTWYDSKFRGAHEELLMEGISAGRSWAVVRNWYPHPRYTSDRAEKYILRIDISEWYTAYMCCICEMHDEMRKACMAVKGRNPHAAASGSKIGRLAGGKTDSVSSCV